MRGQLNILNALGRLGRVRYLAYSLGLPTAIFVGGTLLNSIPGTQGMGKLFFVVYAAMLAIYVILTMQRCHDCDHSGWLALIPGVGVILYIIPGVEDANQWGEPPPPNTIWTIILASAAVLFAGFVSTLLLVITIVPPW
jgi:uncharacterized membrane protein YhaH (DUF805 family)